MLGAVVSFLLRSLVTTLTLAIALRTTPADLRATWRHRRLVLRALLVLDLGVPLFALATTYWLSLPPLAAAVFPLMAACPGSPLVLRFTRGHAVVIVVVAVVSLLAPLTLPLWLLAIDRVLPLGFAVQPWAIARIALAQLVVPLTVGLVFAKFTPRLADQLGRLFFGLFWFSLVVGLVVVIFRGAPILLHVKPVTYLGGVLILLASVLMGHWAGSARADCGPALATVAVLGNPALAIAVADYSRPELGLMSLMAAYLLFRAVVLAFYRLFLRLPPARRRSSGSTAAHRKEPRCGHA